MQNPKQRLLKNIFSNWAGTGVTAIIAFIMSPFLVHTLGKDAYGVWTLIFSIVAYSNFFDAGMKQSLAKYIPKYYGTKNFVGLNQIINSALLIYMITGILIIIFTLVVSFFFVDLIKCPPELLYSMQIALILIGLNQAISFFFMPVAALGPFHRYDILNTIEICKSIIIALLFYFFLINSHGIVTMAIIIFTGSIFTLSTKRFIQQRLVPQIEISKKHIDRSKIKTLLNYGSISFFIVISWLVIFNTDNIVIGMYISTSAVTVYTIAGTIINYLRTIISSIGVPLVPTVSHLESNSQYSQINDIYKKLTKYLFYLTSCICIGIFFFIDDFINLWMGPGFEQTIEIVYILIIPASIYLPQVIANSILLGINKHKLLLKILVCEAVSNVILSLILVQKWGIYGVALGTAIPQFIIYSFVYPYFFNKTISGSIKLFYSQLLKMSFYGILFTLPVSWLLLKFNYHFSWIGFIVNVGITLIFIVLGFYMVILDKNEKIKVISKIRDFIKV